jgi:hypothetical protein
MNPRLFVAVVIALLAQTACRTTAGTERHRDDQTRFEQQQKRYPDRLNRHQELEDAAKARANDGMRKP